jgi:hypothetical protein
MLLLLRARVYMRYSNASRDPCMKWHLQQRLLCTHLLTSAAAAARHLVEFTIAGVFWPTE